MDKRVTTVRMGTFVQPVAAILVFQTMNCQRIFRQTCMLHIESLGATGRSVRLMISEVF